MNKYILLVLLLFVALGAGCSKQSEGSNSTTTPNQPRADEAVPPEFAPSGDAAADLVKMNDRVIAAKSFKAMMLLDGTTPMTTELEFTAPDRYRLKSTGTLEMLYVGRATLIKVGDEWKLMSLPLDPKVGEIRGAFTAENMKDVSNVKYAGDETLNGRPAYLYTYNGRAPRVGAENDSKLWIAKTTGLPLKLESVYKTGIIGTTTIEYDFETPVTIELPAQARRVNPGYSK